MDLGELSGRLDDRLNVDAYADVDPSANGLQVGPPTGTVDHVALAVDGVLATVEAAADAGADVLVVHHGISWGGFDRLTGGIYRRVAALVENDVALYVAHLPLDGHPDLGNAARLAAFLDLEVVGPFAEMGPEYVGQRAGATEPLTVADLRDRLGELEHGDLEDGDLEDGDLEDGDLEDGDLEDGDLEDGDLDHSGGQVQVLPFGPDGIEEVGIVTGAGTDWIGEAREKDLDALVTGEGKQQAYHEAREAGLHVFLAGHYATETLGVRALGTLLERWDLETTYISHPTGL